MPNTPATLFKILLWGTAIGTVSFASAVVLTPIVVLGIALQHLRN